MMHPLELDLMAAYAAARDDVIEQLHKSVEAGEQPEEFIRRALDLIGGQFPEEVEKARKLQGRTEFQGLPVSIENRRGSVREGTNADGEDWRTKMTHPYGYIRGTEGTDGDQVDVFLGPDREATTVFVAHTQNPDTGEYDEDKVMLGFPDEQAARTALLENYDRPGFLQGIESMGMDEFMDRLRSQKGEKVEKDWASPHPITPELQEMVKVEDAGWYGSYRVFVVDDRKVEEMFDPDWAGGGNHMAKPYVPDMELWVGQRIPDDERDEYLEHEAGEDWQMRTEGQDYDTAHNLVTVGEMAERLEEDEGGGEHRTMSDLLGKALAVDVFPLRVAFAVVDDAVWKGQPWPVGTVHNLKGTLWLRLKKTDGKWGDFKKLGPAPGGWSIGDAIPDDLKAAHEEAQKLVDPNAKKQPKPAAEPGKGPPHLSGGNYQHNLSQHDEETNAAAMNLDHQGFTQGLAEWMNNAHPDLYPKYEDAKQVLDDATTADILAYASHNKYVPGKEPDDADAEAKHQALEAIYDEDKDQFAAALAVEYKKLHPEGPSVDKLHANIMSMDKGAVLAEAKAAGLTPDKLAEWGIGQAEAKAKAPAPGVASLLKEFDAPLKLPPIKKTEDLGGTTGAKKIVFDHPLGGEYTGVLKHGASPEHAVEEHQANLLYAMMGVHVPASHLYEHDGKKAMVSAFVQGKAYSDLTADEKTAVKNDLKQHFAVDALLGNWDVTGADFDNVLWDGNNTVRIDNGGSLRFRAQGAAKGDSFGKTVDELETMRDPSKLAGKLVFSGVTDKEVSEQIKKIVSKKADILSAVKDDGLRETLGARIDYMKQWAADKAKAPAKPAAKPAAPPPPKPAEHQHGKVVSQKPAGMKFKMDYPPLREKQQSAFRSYQQGSEVNTPLRGFVKPTASQQAKIDAMDAYYADMPEWDVAGHLGHPLWRGVGPAFMGNWFKGLALPKFSITASDLDKKTPAGKLTWREALTKTMVGSMFYDQGYFGSSVKEDTAHGFMHMPGSCDINNTGAHVKFVVTGKTKAVEIESLGHGGYDHEAEVLWPRGQGFRVKGVEFKNKGNQNWVELHVEAEEGF